MPTEAQPLHSSSRCSSTQYGVRTDSKSPDTKARSLLLGPHQFPRVLLCRSAPGPLDSHSCLMALIRGKKEGINPIGATFPITQGDVEHFVTGIKESSLISPWLLTLGGPGQELFVQKWKVVLNSS